MRKNYWERLLVLSNQVDELRDGLFLSRREREIQIKWSAQFAFFRIRETPVIKRHPCVGGAKVPTIKHVSRTYVVWNRMRKGHFPHISHIFLRNCLVTKFLICPTMQKKILLVLLYYIHCRRASDLSTYYCFYTYTLGKAKGTRIGQTYVLTHTWS